MPKTYTYEDVMKNNRSGGCWLIIHEKVYDVASFKDHPGGGEKLTSAAARGGDASLAFEKVGEHCNDPRVREEMVKYYKGNIDMPTVPIRRTHRSRVTYRSAVAYKPSKRDNFTYKVVMTLLLIMALLLAFRIYTAHN